MIEYSAGQNDREPFAWLKTFIALLMKERNLRTHIWGAKHGAIDCFIKEKIAFELYGKTCIRLGHNARDKTTDLAFWRKM